MNCTFCGKDPDVFVLIPGKMDGSRGPFACVECATENGLYCKEHDTPHTGFVGDDSTACLRCVEEDVQGSRDRAEEIYDRIKGAVSDENWNTLYESVETSSEITGDEDSVSLLRFIATIAHRRHITIDDVVVIVFGEESSSLLFPRIIF